MRKKRNGIFVYLLMLTLFLSCTGCGTEEMLKESVNEETPSEQSEEPEAEGLALPVELDSDKLELISVFGYSGINPDCEDVMGENIGAIQIKNISGQYLESARICVVLSDGQQLNFLAEDVPAEMEVMAFEIQNLEYDDTLKIVEVLAETEYRPEASEEEFTYSVSGNEITVENISGEDKNRITLQYHCTIDGIAFGGKSYEMTIEELEAGESSTVFDTFCYMGDVTVVSVND